MAEEKDLHPRAGQAENEPTTASRARNKTVMLSPEMTGQVRAILQHEPAPAGAAAAPAKPGVEDYLPPLVDWGTAGRTPGAGDEGFLRPKGAPDGFSALDSLVDSGSSQKFDPLTSVAPSVTFGGSARESEPRGGNQSLFGGGDTGLLFGNPASCAPSALQMQQPAPSFAAPQQPARQAPPAQQVFQAAPAAAPAAAQAPQRAAQPAAAPAAGPKNWNTVITAGEPGKLVGLFISYDLLEGGEIFEVRSGRFLITSRPTDNGDYLLISDDSVSPLHAIVRATKDGALQVLDQLSEHGTGVIRAGSEDEEEISGSLAVVQHGDVVRFGKRMFTVVAIPQVRKTR